MLGGFRFMSHHLWNKLDNILLTQKNVKWREVKCDKNLGCQKKVRLDFFVFSGDFNVMVVGKNVTGKNPAHNIIIKKV